MFLYTTKIVDDFFRKLISCIQILNVGLPFKTVDVIFARFLARTVRLCMASNACGPLSVGDFPPSASATSLTRCQFHQHFMSSFFCTRAGVGKVRPVGQIRFVKFFFRLAEKIFQPYQQVFHVKC